MMVMPGCNASGLVHWLAGRFPGRIGWLIGPTHRKTPKPWLPFALDNDAYISYSQGKPWDEAAWIDLLKWTKGTCQDPLWALVPDVVCSKTKTLQFWDKYAGVVSGYGWLKAFAVQDGMEPHDVPREADVIFVGGSTRWKWRSLPTWLQHFDRVHVGRVNSIHRLLRCSELGVESIDGSGWFMDTVNGGRATGLVRWLEGVKFQNTPMIPGLDT